MTTTSTGGSNFGTLHDRIGPMRQLDPEDYARARRFTERLAGEDSSLMLDMLSLGGDAA